MPVIDLIKGIPASFFATVNPVSYRNFSPSPEGGAVFPAPNVLLLRMGEAVPPITSYALIVWNNTNQQATVQAIANIQDSRTLPPSQNFPDYNVGSAQAIPASAAAALYPLFDQNPVEYISVQISYATVPTQGIVAGYALIVCEVL